MARLELDFSPSLFFLFFWRSLTLYSIPVTLPYTQYTHSPIYHTSFLSTSASTLSLYNSTYPLLGLPNSAYLNQLSLPNPFLFFHLHMSTHLYHIYLPTLNYLHQSSSLPPPLLCLTPFPFLGFDQLLSIKQQQYHPMVKYQNALETFWLYRSLCLTL